MTVTMNSTNKKTRSNDFESRKIRDDFIWYLKENSFDKIKNLLGNPSVDSIASRTNFKVKRFTSYYSDPTPISMDTFAIPWGVEKVYVFLPFSLINRLIQKSN